MVFTMDDAREISGEFLEKVNTDPAEIIKNGCVLLEIEHNTLFKLYEDTLMCGAISGDTSPDNVKFRRILNEQLKKWRK